jgi:hypothetical protein
MKPNKPALVTLGTLAVVMIAIGRVSTNDHNVSPFALVADAVDGTVEECPFKQLSRVDATCVHVANESVAGLQLRVVRAPAVSVHTSGFSGNAYSRTGFATIDGRDYEVLLIENWIAFAPTR